MGKANHSFWSVVVLLVAGIEVWVYWVPPSERPPNYGTRYSEPFRLDYARWGEEIARLSLTHPNLTAWVIGDFYANHAFFTPACLREIQARSKAINPRLAFLPLMYSPEIRPQFVEDYLGQSLLGESGVESMSTLDFDVSGAILLRDLLILDGLPLEEMKRIDQVRKERGLPPLFTE